MKKPWMTLALFSALLSTGQAAWAEDCTKDQAKESVLKACQLIETKGEAAQSEIQQYRYCGTNYVWVQKAEGDDIIMVNHPIQARLNGKSIKENKDEKGKQLFLEFDKAARANPDGAWVDYVWTKPGDESATPKSSFVKLCGGAQGWISGSGVWTSGS